MKRIKIILRKLYFLVNERKYKDRLKFVFKNNNYSTLIVSFSGFAPKPVYNYMRTLKGVKADQLYILDDFGLTGSYYWFENGEDIPRQLTHELICRIISRRGYDRVIMIGSSKGGTCAIYYGLMIGATDIYAGACQYYAGNYLNTADHLPILKAMMGNIPNDAAVNIVNRMLPDMIKQSAGGKSHIHLLYSKDEHTYNDHIRYLIEDLKKYSIPFDEKVASFVDHNEVGKFFSPWIIKELKNRF